MRNIDWSSDVGSSDLRDHRGDRHLVQDVEEIRRRQERGAGKAEEDDEEEQRRERPDVAHLAFEPELEAASLRDTAGLWPQHQALPYAAPRSLSLLPDQSATSFPQSGRDSLRAK